MSSGSFRAFSRAVVAAMRQNYAASAATKLSGNLCPSAVACTSRKDFLLPMPDQHPIVVVQQRDFRSHLPWEYYLVTQWNAYDEDLVEELGPEKAAAQWLTNNGAKIRYVDDINYTKDEDLQRFCVAGQKIESINAANSTISSQGFRYLKNLTHLKELLLVDCKHIDDKALGKLDYVKDTLKVLAVDACPEVTALGLMSLAKLRNLRHLHIGRLFIRRSQMKYALRQLQKAMPRCKVETSGRKLVEKAVKETGNWQAVVPCLREKKM